WSAAHYLRRAELDLPALVLNGALGRDNGAGDIFHRRAFDPADARRVLEVFERQGVNPCVNFECERWDLVSGPSPSSGQVYLTGAGPQLKVVGDLGTMAGSLPVYAFSVVAVPEIEVLRCIRDELAEFAGVGSVNLVRDKVFGGWTLDCSPRGVNKWI